MSTIYEKTLWQDYLTQWYQNLPKLPVNSSQPVKAKPSQHLPKEWKHWGRFFSTKVSLDMHVKSSHSSDGPKRRTMSEEELFKPAGQVEMYAEVKDIQRDKRKTGGLKCAICGEIRSGKRSGRQHIYDAHEEIYGVLEGKVRHLLQKQPEKETYIKDTIYKCRLWKKHFSTEEITSKHLRKKHGIQDVLCVLCQMICRNRKLGLDHFKFKHPEYEITLKDKPSREDQEEYNTYEITAYREFRKIPKSNFNSNEKTKYEALFTCTKCKYRFNTQEESIMHWKNCVMPDDDEISDEWEDEPELPKIQQQSMENYVPARKPQPKINGIECPVCKKLLLSQELLDQHFSVMHRDEDLNDYKKRPPSLFEWESCDVPFSFEFQLRLHLETFHVFDPWRCIWGTKIRNAADKRFHECTQAPGRAVAALLPEIVPTPSQLRPAVNQHERQKRPEIYEID